MLAGKQLDRQIEHPGITTLVPVPGQMALTTAHCCVTGFRGFLGFFFASSSVNTDKLLGLKKVPCLSSNSWPTPKKSVFQENNLH